MRLRTYARVPMPLGLVALTLAGAGIVSAVLMLASLGQRPLWFDETVSVEAARLSTPSLAHYVATVESNMSLYHVLLHLWLGAGGGDGFARSLSVLFGLMTLPVLFALARRLFDTRTAAIAVVLLAANVNFVGHAREARGYSLAVLLVTMSSLFLVRAVQDGDRRDWLLFGVAGVLAVYAHLLAALAIAAQLGSVLILRRRIPMRPFASTAAAMTLLLAPLATALVLHPQRQQIDWITQPRPRQLPGLFVWFTDSWTLSAIFGAAGSPRARCSRHRMATRPDRYPNVALRPRRRVARGSAGRRLRDLVRAAGLPVPVFPRLSARTRDPRRRRPRANRARVDRGHGQCRSGRSLGQDDRRMHARVRDRR